MARRTRLDVELARRGLARSRRHAQELIDAGRVLVAGLPATKAATQVDPAAPIVLTAVGEPDYVSRGGHKLASALDQLPQVSVAGKRCLDAGASTGGFTDVLLRRGAERVLAVDVGYGQLAWSLRTDDRVVVLDRTNVRHLTAQQVDGALGGRPHLLVSDVSFISLRLLLPALAAVADEQADFVLMVKPQFEVGKGRVGAGGVVRDRGLRIQAVTGVIQAARDAGLHGHDVAASALPGPRGNVEYFVWLRAEPGNLTDEQLAGRVETAVDHGPGPPTTGADGPAGRNDRTGGNGHQPGSEDSDEEEQ